jgi:peptide/bleomycin uptake transporter
VFRSFFPNPRIFFPSAIVWLLFLVGVWFTVGEPVRSAVSIDRFFVPPFCAVTAPADQPAAPSSAASQAASEVSAAADTASSALPIPDASSAAAAPAGAPAAAQNCIPPDDSRFLSGEKIWQYEFVFLGAVLFCIFWYFFRNEWYWWSVVMTTFILLAVYFNVQISAWINQWYNDFYNLIQLATTGPNKITAEQFYTKLFSALYVVVCYIIVQAFVGFATSHYVFRWRKAMNFYYMRYWQQIRTYEGAAQRVQEDTQQFASIIEGLGTTFVGSFMSLLVFAPLLWTLSAQVPGVPIFGTLPGSLMWLALSWSAFGTVLFAVTGVRLPFLNFQNQRVEAAYRKELVYGEDDPTRADPPTVRQLFANMQKNYFRLYFNYLYFNLVRYTYLQVDNFFLLPFLGPGFVAGAITFGLFQQVGDAFGRVTGAFQFLANSWTTIVELQSVRRRLKDFESHIPRADQGDIDTGPPLPAPEPGF